MEEDMEEFYKLVKPVSEYIAKKYDPHTTIIITDTNAKIVSDGISVVIQND